MVPEFPVENESDGISGKDSNDPNFRSDSDSSEFPVEASQSIARLRKSGRLPKTAVNPHAYAEPVEDKGSDAPESHVKAPLTNEQQPWVVEAMTYYQRRLNQLEATMVGVLQLQEECSRLLEDIDAKLDRLIAGAQ